MVKIIAEAGTNHGGSVETARELTRVAAAVGADVVKFQMLYAEGLYVPGTWSGEHYTPSEVFALRRQQELTEAEWLEVHKEATRTGIPLAFSIFDERGLAFQEQISPPFIKIASCDLNNIPFLRKVAATGRKILLATGMATLQEIEDAVTAIVSEGNTDITLMHCVSVYPCPTERTNLSFISVLKTAFGFPVGFSDHTESSVAACVAVALGAEWLEKHITLDRKAVGFDHSYAMEPHMFRDYVADVRAVESACKPQVPKVSDEEMNTRRRARRSLYAARALRRGETLRPEDVLIVRPEGPLSPADLTRIVGRKLNRDVKQYEALTWDMF